jgi:hypothetical protein
VLLGGMVEALGRGKPVIQREFRHGRKSVLEMALGARRRLGIRLRIKGFRGILPYGPSAIFGHPSYT